MAEDNIWIYVNFSSFTKSVATLKKIREDVKGIVSRRDEYFLNKQVLSVQALIFLQFFVS
jgi:hypothetical protein